MANYTLFRRALLTTGEVNKLIARAYECFYTRNVQIEFYDKANVYVCQNIIYVVLES